MCLSPVDFADKWIKIEGSKMMNTWILLESLKHEDDGDTNDSWSPWNGIPCAWKRDYGNWKYEKESWPFKPSGPQYF